VILPDQYRADCLGFRGIHPQLRTPHLDRLAAQGISFDRAVSPAPLCGPARCAIFSGRYPHQARGILEEEKLGARDYMEIGVERDMMINTTSLREPPLLTSALAGQGYHLAYAGKWHLGEDVLSDWFPLHSGSRHAEYLDWLRSNDLPESGWPLTIAEVRSRREPHMSIPRTKPSSVAADQTNDAWVTDIALRYLRERPRDRPFCLVCGLNGPHPPFVVPEPYYSMYDPAALERPANFGPCPGEPASKARSFYRQLFADHGADWDAWRQPTAVYHGYCSFIDAQVGRLLAGLEQQGILDTTLVVFASDHGEMLGQHGLWHKMQAYEESLRVPLIFSAPWLAGGRRRAALASLLDIPATLLGAVGLPVPDSYEGEDLGPILRGERTDMRRQYLFAEQEPLGHFHGEVDWRMVADGRWKYIWNCADSAELYDLETDPGETHNLAVLAQHAGRLSAMHDRLVEWMTRTSDPLLSGLLAGRLGC
jgi:arylsulfatase A-like enzyme